MPELDRIYIRDLRVRCIIGIYPEERRALQEIEINVVMHVDLRKPGATDSIEDTVDYKSVKKAIAAHVETSQCLLIERLSQEIADICLAVRGVEKVQVTVDKPGALRFARSVAVEITRTKA